MKEDIHPKFYPDAKVTCACGNTWTTGSTQKEIRTEVCSKCHPFFTGEQARLIDMEGQVDRFYKKLQAREEFIEEEKRKMEEKISPDRPVEDLDLGGRANSALEEAGNSKVVKRPFLKFRESEEKLSLISRKTYANSVINCQKRRKKFQCKFS